MEKSRLRSVVPKIPATGSSLPPGAGTSAPTPLASASDDQRIEPINPDSRTSKSALPAASPVQRGVSAEKENVSEAGREAPGSKFIRSRAEPEYECTPDST